MGVILNNIVENMMNNKPICYTVEYNTKPGWYLFDISQDENRTEAIWVKDIRMCLGWASEEAAWQLLAEFGIFQLDGKVKVTKIK